MPSRPFHRCLFISLPLGLLSLLHVARAQTGTATPGASNAPGVMVAGAKLGAVALGTTPSLGAAQWFPTQRVPILISGNIAQTTFGARMQVSPQTINPNSAKSGGKSGSAPLPTVQIKITVPDLVRNSRLDFNSIKINSQPIALADKTDSEPKIGPRYVHLFFNRDQIVSILGIPAGQRVVTLQITVGSGHLLVASDTIKLL